MWVGYACLSVSVGIANYVNRTESLCQFWLILGARPSEDNVHNLLITFNLFPKDNGRCIYLFMISNNFFANKHCLNWNNTALSIFVYSCLVLSLFLFVCFILTFDFTLFSLSSSKTYHFTASTIHFSFHLPHFFEFYV